MISILSKAATWFREQPFGEAFSCVFSSPPCSAQLIWTAVMSMSPGMQVWDFRSIASSPALAAM